MPAAYRRCEGRTRFTREIHTLGRVKHPHLVEVYAPGSEGEHYFYAMELIEGADLSAVCAAFAAKAEGGGRRSWKHALSTACEHAKTKEESLSGEKPAPQGEPGIRAESPHPIPAAEGAPADHVKHAAEIVQQIALAAQALHEAKVVHRDIKPGNIMLRPDGSAVLVDLGLAQLADETQRNLTRTRQFVGSLPYASPEQITARFKLDHRSDVYSLGAVLWELLACRPIYGITDDTPTDEIFRRIQFDDPGSVRQHNRAVNRDLEAIVHKCLEKNPTDRYPTAAALAKDLERWQKHEAVQARPQTLFSGVLRRVRKHQRVVAITAGWLATILLVVGWAFWMSGGSGDSPIVESPPEVLAESPQPPAGRGAEGHEVQGSWSAARLMTIPIIMTSQDRATMWS